MTAAVKKYRAIALLGPTASGKTSLALKLAEKFPIEIISVDSALIYRDMNIGTAKPDAQTLKRIPHHLIDICDPTESYSAAKFAEDATCLIKEICNRAALPLLVGGTMMYFNALFKGLAKLPDADLAIREKLNDLLMRKGSAYLHAQLEKIDPASAQRIHPNDPQRLQRALEVFELTGKPLSELWKETASDASIDYLKIAITPSDRTVLHHLIAQRFDEMLAQGFIEEVKQLYSCNNLSPNLPSVRSVGYRQAWAYLMGEYDFSMMREKAIVATRQLAKRQLTWLRSFEDLNWFDSSDPCLVEKVVALISSFRQR